MDTKSLIQFHYMKLKLYLESIDGATNGHLSACKPNDKLHTDTTDTCRCNYQLNIYPNQLMKDLFSDIIEKVFR